MCRCHGCAAAAVCSGFGNRAWVAVVTATRPPPPALWSRKTKLYALVLHAAAEDPTTVTVKGPINYARCFVQLLPAVTTTNAASRRSSDCYFFHWFDGHTSMGSGGVAPTPSASCLVWRRRCNQHGTRR